MSASVPVTQRDPRQDITRQIGPSRNSGSAARFESRLSLYPGHLNPRWMITSVRRLCCRTLAATTSHVTAGPVLKLAPNIRRLLGGEEGANERDGRRGILFHDPVARIRDDAFGHVARRQTRMTVAIVGPNDFSPPSASTGIVELAPRARNALLSMAS